MMGWQKITTTVKLVGAGVLGENPLLTTVSVWTHGSNFPVSPLHHNAAVPPS